MPSDRFAQMPLPPTGQVPMDRALARLLILGALSLVALGLFLTLGVPHGAWGFALPFRAGKLVALVLVAYAIATSTQLFHVATRNQILTPAIMGFDALYLMLQAGLVFFLGAMATQDLEPVFKFSLEVILMMVFSTGLFLWLFSAQARDLHLLVLVGIIFGTLFRSLSSFISRMIDPNDFVVVQGASFAQFNTVNIDLVWITLVLCAFTLPVLWALRHQFDVLALGRDTAINLGLAYRRVMLITFAMIGLLVSVSTALVGPVTFFGLLVTHLAYRLLPGARFGQTWVAATLVAVITLVGGQAVFEHVLGFKGTLSVVIDLLGGLVFLTLLFKGAQR